MPINNQVVIDVKAQYKNAGMSELKAALTQARKELDSLKSSGQQGTQVWDNQKSKIAGLYQSVQGLSREYKGLDANVKASGFQMLEFGENLTVVVAGITQVVSKVKEYVKELYNLTKAGAEYDVLYNTFVKLSGGVENARVELDLLSKAAAGNLNDSELIKYANKMKELGYNTTQTAQLLDLAETKSDELGTTIEEGTDKILRFLETGKGKGLYNLGIDIGEVNKKMIELSGLTEAQIKNLTEESAQRLRTKATLDLYGNSLDAINKKQKDNADKMVAMEKNVENLKLAFGQTFSAELFNQIDNIGKAFENVTGKQVEMEKSSRSLGSYLGEAFGKILPFLAGGFAGIATEIISATLASDKMKDVFENLRLVFKGFLKMLASPIPDAWVVAFADAVDWAKEQLLSYLKLLNSIPGIELLIPDKIFFAKKSKPSWAQGSTSTMAGDEEYEMKDGKDGSENNKKENDAVQDLIDSIKFKLEYDKEFHNLKLDDLHLMMKELEISRDGTEDLKDKFKLQQQFNDVNKNYWNRLKIDKDSTIGTVSTSETPEVLDRGYKQYENTGSGFIQKSLNEMFWSNRAFATDFINQIKEGIGSIGNVFSNALTFLGLEKNKFVSGLVQGFNRVLSIVQIIADTLSAISTVRSIVSTIASFATGGISGGISGGGAAGMNYGNISNPYQQIVNMTHTTNSQPIFRPNINVIVQSEVERTKMVKILDEVMPTYNNYIKQTQFAS